MIAWIRCFDATSNLRHARRENRIRSVMILCTLKRPSVSTITKSINTSLDTKASRCRFQTPTIRSYTTTLVVHRIICIFVLITLLYWTRTLYTRLHSHTVTTQQKTALIGLILRCSSQPWPFSSGPLALVRRQQVVRKWLTGKVYGRLEWVQQSMD